MPAKKLMFQSREQKGTRRKCVSTRLFGRSNSGGYRRTSKSHAAYNPILSHDVRVAASSW